MAVQDSRLESLRAACAERGAAAFYVRNTSDIRWLTGFDGVFDTEAAHLLLVTADGAWLHTDSRYVTAAEMAAAGTSISVDASVRTHAAFTAEKLAEACRGAEAGDGVCADGGTVAGCRDACGGTPALAVAIDDSMSLAEFRRLEKAFSESCSDTEGAGPCAAAEGADPCAAAEGGPFATITETSGLILNLRAVKDGTEIARLAASQAITDAAFSHIIGFIRPGMTERMVQLALDDFMMRSGAEGLAFSTIIATGAHGASPHAIPGDTVLEAGQCVVMDFGAKLAGYCSDMTRMVFLGEPDQRMREAYAVLRRANEEVEAALKPGMTGIEAHELAERILEEGGFGGKMGHGLGHGVGLDIHEQPNLNRRNDKPLVPGNVVTVEPGIYLPGEFGMRLEDFGLITRSGFAAFTQSTHDMVVL